MTTRTMAIPAPQRRSVAAQMLRKAELDEIRLARPLTAAERAEDDNLTHRAYMRQWRAALALESARHG